MTLSVECSYLDLYDLIYKLDIFHDENDEYREEVVIFNPGSVRWNETTVIYSIRIMLLPVPINENLIPGNSPDCRNQISTGKNFIWNYWGDDEDITQGTIFCLFDETTSQFRHLNLNFKKYSRIMIEDTDVRISKINGQFVYYTTDLSEIYTMQLSNNNLVLNKYSESYQLQVNAKNLQMIAMNFNQYVYMNGFGSNGVEFYRKFPFLPNRSKKQKTLQELMAENRLRQQQGQEIIIPFENNNKINYNGSATNKNNETNIGNNNGIMPMFSLGTPFIDIDNYKLGVGHIKIYNNIEYKYRTNSSIDMFRKYLDTELGLRFGDRYIKHFGSTRPPDCIGYIYMLYFIILGDFIDDIPQTILISNAYLPVPGNRNFSMTDYDLDYKFSLIFPTGLYTSSDMNNLIVTCGYGDTYCINLTFNLEDVINETYIDAKSVDLSLYTYNLIYC